MQDIEISGYYPGVVGKITEIHAVYYHEHWGFDVSFETEVGKELSEFVGQFDTDRDGLWVATKNGEFAGDISIFRWFKSGSRHHDPTRDIFHVYFLLRALLKETKYMKDCFRHSFFISAQR